MPGASMPTAAPELEALRLDVAGGPLARSHAASVQEAGVSALLSLVRLRRLDVRRAAVQSGWDVSLSGVLLDLGAALRARLAVVDSLLQHWVSTTTTMVEDQSRAVFAAQARRRSAERSALGAARDWLMHAPTEDADAPSPRVL